MKVLFFVDIHKDVKKARKIAEKSKHADLVVCAGDLSNGEEGFGDVIEELSKIRKPMLIIPGNNETPEFVEDAVEDYENIIPFHNDIYQDQNIRFLGIGGGTISPFNTMYELSEEEFEKLLGKHGKDIDVLVCHCPPKGTELDLTATGLHVGSSSIRNWIEENQPKYCCCGHIHEAAGKKIAIGKTICFNPGPEGVIIEI